MTRRHRRLAVAAVVAVLVAALGGMNATQAAQRTATLGVSVQVVTACAATLAADTGAVALGAGCAAAAPAMLPPVGVAAEPIAPSEVTGAPAVSVGQGALV